jgi:hypothetical protein
MREAFTRKATPPFHGGNTGSNPVRVANEFSLGKSSDPGFGNGNRKKNESVFSNQGRGRRVHPRTLQGRLGSVGGTFTA